MSLLVKLLRLLLRFETFETDGEISKDSAKFTLIFARVLANIINIWPEKSDPNRMYTGILSVICGIHTSSLIMSLILGPKDVGTVTMVISQMEAVLQTSAKCVTLIYKSKQLKALIRTIRNEFWPSDITSETVDRQIRNDSVRVLKLISTEFITAAIFVPLGVIAPLTKRNRELPYTAWYPFDWTASPVYEVLYFFHTYFSVCVDMSAVLGYDFLYVSVCTSCTAQFRLLCDAIAHIGAGDEEEVIERLSNISGVDSSSSIGGYSNDWKEKKLLRICIQHHQKLIRTCQDINKHFGNGHLVQLLVSALGICTTCYSITIETNFNARTYLMVFYISHVFQLFIYCYVSNELSYWSTRVPMVCYDTFWYLRKYPEIKKSLGIVMTRSQAAISMNALGLFELNDASFISVMRLTFSLYTFLTTMAEK